MRPRIKNRPAPSENLAAKYRPASWDHVIGQDAVVASLRSNIARGHLPRASIFIGPSGVGKTTIARLIASELQIDKASLLEIDAASISSVKEFRHLLESIRYRAIGPRGQKLVILDECHALSTASWQALLKPLEEPPAHLWWVLCTTAPEQVPRTVRTRCANYVLRKVDGPVIERRLVEIAGAESLSLSRRAIEQAARCADGSVRMAISFLSAANGLDDLDAAALMQAA